LSSLVRAPLRALAAVVTLAIVAACSDSSTGPSTGTLTVNITTPAGITGSVTVSGPNGYTKTLTATQSLTGLPAGTYTIVGAQVVTPAGIVGSDTSVATVTGSPATVGRSATATVTVAYGAGSGSATTGLWIANALSSPTSNEFVKFNVAQLTTSGAPTPIAGLIGQNDVGVVAVAFDRQGDLWAVAENGTITEFTAAQLDSTNPTPVRNLTVNGSSNVSALAFDSTGNLWLADPEPCFFYEYSAATLANHTGSATLTPDISFTPGCNSPVGNPIAIAFDAHWNLWVSDDGDEDIYEYPADSLKAGFSGLNAARVIGGITSAGYVAFDASGNLWSTTGPFNNGDDTVFVFTASQLADTTSAPRPQVSIAVATSSPSELDGVAIDNSGDLWFVDRLANKVYELSASQLGASGSATPTVILSASSNSLAAPYGLAFSPHSSGLPLFAHLAPAPSSARGRVRR
jgi:hypothetical protein